MIKKLKTIFADIKDAAKVKPLTFATLCFGFLYGIFLTVFGLAQVSFYIGFTGCYGLILAVSKYFALREVKGGKAYSKQIAICTTALGFLHFSFSIVTTFFHEESSRDYNLFLIITVAAIAFVKIIASTIQAVITRKNKNDIIRQIKLFDTANALIGLALLQRTILYFIDFENRKIISAIGGIFFSFCAMTVSLFMFRKHKKIQSNIIQKN
jgi:hypothetical protein